MFLHLLHGFALSVLHNTTYVNFALMSFIVSYYIIQMYIINFQVSTGFN